LISELAYQQFNECHSTDIEMSKKVRKFTSLLKHPKSAFYSMLCSLHVELRPPANNTIFKKQVRKRYDFFQVAVAPLENPRQKRKRCKNVAKMLQQAVYELRAMIKTIGLSKALLVTQNRDNNSVASTE
jgi:hypothetical protein